VHCALGRRTTDSFSRWSPSRRARSPQVIAYPAVLKWQLLTLPTTRRTKPQAPRPIEPKRIQEQGSPTLSQTAAKVPRFVQLSQRGDGLVMENAPGFRDPLDGKSPSRTSDPVQLLPSGQCAHRQVGLSPVRKLRPIASPRARKPDLQNIAPSPRTIRKYPPIRSRRYFHGPTRTLSFRARRAA
jgi:hypothetical protein